MTEVFITNVGKGLGIHTDPNTSVCGMYISGNKDECWQFTCPCGVTDVFPINGLPEVDTPQSCGVPNHWTVKYAKESKLKAREPGDEDRFLRLEKQVQWLVNYHDRQKSEREKQDDRREVAA